MAAVKVFNVDFHFENGGKICSPVYYTSIVASANDYNSVITVLNNNVAALLALGIPVVWPNGVLVIDNVQADPSGNQSVFS